MIILLIAGPTLYGPEMSLMNITLPEGSILEMRHQILQTRYTNVMVILGMLV